MTRADLDAIRERVAEIEDYPSPLPWVNLAIRDRRALLAEVDRLRVENERLRLLMLGDALDAQHKREMGRKP